jgi:hypothetical protein
LVIGDELSNIEQTLPVAGVQKHDILQGWRLGARTSSTVRV